MKSSTNNSTTQRSSQSKTPLLILLIIIIAAGAIVVVSYFGQTQMKEATVLRQSLQQANEKIVAMKKQITPFFYVRYLPGPGEPIPEIRVVDPETGEDSLLYSNENQPFILYAVPRLGYDGRIFLNRYTPGTEQFQTPYVFNVATKENPVPVSFADKLPFATFAGAQVLSPDERRIVVAYDNPYLDPKDVVQKEIAVWDLLTGEKTVIGKVAENEYLARFVGENVMGGANDFALSWRDLRCVDVYVFEDYPPGTPGKGPEEKKFKQIRTFCLP